MMGLDSIMNMTLGKLRDFFTQLIEVMQVPDNEGKHIHNFPGLYFHGSMEHTFQFRRDDKQLTIKYIPYQDRIEFSEKTPGLLNQCYLYVGHFLFFSVQRGDTTEIRQCKCIL